MVSWFKRQKNTITICLLAVVLLVTLRLSGSRKGIIEEVNTDLPKFPLVVGKWKSDGDLPQSERVYKILATRNLFVRDYRNPRGETVNLFIVFSDVNRTSFHPPEICMIGGGGKLVKKAAEPLDLEGLKRMDLNSFVMENNGNSLLILYWFVVGDKMTGSVYQQQKYLLERGLKGVGVTGAMVRVAVEIEKQDYEKALNLAKGFIKEILPLIPKYLVKK